MSNQIYKFSNGLAEISSMDLFVSNANALIVSQISDGVFSCETELPFTINVSKNQIPHLEEEEIMIVMREKVNLSAHGKNYVQIKNSTLDTDIESAPKPYRPLVIPNGFTELKGKNE